MIKSCADGLLTVGIMVPTRHFTVRNFYKTGLRLAAVLAAATSLTACGMNAPFYGKVGESQSSSLGSESQPATPETGGTAPAAAPVAVAALDPINAAPPTTNTPPAAPSHDALLVPAPSSTPKADGSQRVPLGTFGASAPASGAPTSITQPPAKQQAAAAPAAPSGNQLEQAPAAPSIPVATPAAAPAAQPPLIQPRAANTSVTPSPAPAPQVTQAAPAPTPAPVAAPTEKPKAPVLTMPPAKNNVGAPANRPAREEEPQETVIISSDSSKPVFESREFVPASVVPSQRTAVPQRGLSDIPMTAGEKNVVQRFETLRRLLDENLITQEEYGRRRAANIGALLAYTREPGAVGLERSVPSADAIMARLQALRRSFEMRAITATQHALERTMILNALLPENPDDRTDRRAPPEDVIEGAAMVGRLEVMRNKNLISTAELDAEKNAIEYVLRTGLLPSQDVLTGDKKAGGKTASAGKAKAGAAAAGGAGAEAQVTEAEITGPVLHLASFRSEESAKRAWQEASTGNKAALASLKPIIKRVDLGPDKGIFYRLMTGPFKSLSDAEAVCIQLKQNNQFCRASADGS